MLFQKQNLAGTHYEWNNGSTTLFNGQPSRRLFDRFNGDQVLFLINFYASLSDRFTLEEGRTIEHQIAHAMPDEIKSEISVFNWLRTFQPAEKL
jgi:hypothetical protein